jgi:hypothetical protein
MRKNRTEIEQFELNFFWLFSSDGESSFWLFWCHRLRSFRAILLVNQRVVGFWFPDDACRPTQGMGMLKMFGGSSMYPHGRGFCQFPYIVLCSLYIK